MSYDPQSMNVFDDRQKQALDARYGPNWVPVGAAEGPVPRWAAQTTAPAVSAGVYFPSRIRLEAKPYTTVTFVKATPQGTALANAYVALHNASTNLLVAQTAESAALIQAPAVNTQVVLAMAYTPPAAADYWIGLLIGSGTTPAFLRCTTQIGPETLLQPQIAGQHTTAGLTAPPATLNPTANQGFGIWFRYQ